MNSKISATQTSTAQDVDNTDFDTWGDYLDKNNNWVICTIA